ncbi:MAG: hypothetical protein NTX66_00990 [Candidatus Falkowbacteria bacterium]|nr:hypothetical protein [Candidatus Falkowbacteria bacterium]
MTPEEFKKKINEEYASYYRSDEVHCDTWQVFNFISSSNQRFVAYLVDRIYENYGYPYDQGYNELFVHDLETGKSQGTGMIKFEESGNNFYSKEDRIDSVISVSDKGQVVYKTRDGKEHIITLS